MEEEWQIVPDSVEIAPDMNSDWTFYKVTERNIQSLLPRLGHLLQDAAFDLETFRLEGLNFRVKRNQQRKISSSDVETEEKGKK